MTGCAVDASEPCLLAFGTAGVDDVIMLLATTVLRFPRVPPWLIWMASGRAAAVAPSYLQEVQQGGVEQGRK